MKVTVSPHKININNTNKYKVVIEGISTRLRLSKEVRKNKVTISRIKDVGSPTIYTTPEQRHEAIKKSKRKSNAKKVERYKKDIDKSLSPTKDTYRVLAAFIATHYRFTHFITLTTGIYLDKYDRKKTYSKSDYEYNIKQQKYVSKGATTLQEIQAKTEYYLSRLIKNGNKVYSHYFVSYEQNTAGEYHAHIAINIVDDSIINKYSYTKSRWTHGIMKTKKIKEKNHAQQTQKVLSYLCKDINEQPSQLITWTTDINYYTPRIHGEKDLTKDFNHWFPDGIIVKASA